MGGGGTDSGGGQA